MVVPVVRVGILKGVCAGVGGGRDAEVCVFVCA